MTSDLVPKVDYQCAVRCQGNQTSTKIVTKELQRNGGHWNCRSFAEYAGHL